MGFRYPFVFGPIAPGLQMCLVSPWVPGTHTILTGTSAMEAAPDPMLSLMLLLWFNVLLLCPKADQAQGLTNKCQVGVLIYTHALYLSLEMMLSLPFPTSPT